ncbi:MAG TPA: hypothetical protein VF624_02875 [Tepidisphaeraceae bacterium]|jgi:hypothetical protein
MTRTAAALALTALIANGCTEAQRGTYGPVHSEPLTIDPAMQLREWEPTPALYANGDTFSWSTGFAYEPIGGNENAYYVTDVGTFFVNLVTLPVTYATEGLHVRYQGFVVPPSYTANPPLPPEQPRPATYEPTTRPTT